MSWKASGFVLDLVNKHEELSPSHVLVLLALAARHNDRDYHCAFGQLNKIADDTHLHPVTISNLLSELEDLCLITIWEGQLPRRKGDPEDRRKTRGTMWCFVGLDADDGPCIEGSTRRLRRVGPGPNSVSPELNESVSPGLNEFEPRSADRLARLRSKSTQPVNRPVNRLREREIPVSDSLSLGPVFKPVCVGGDDALLAELSGGVA